MSVGRKRRFLLCLRNRGCDDLERRKVYEQLRDEVAEAEGWVRVIDESGEDYLYPEKYFVALELPQAALRALANGRRGLGPTTRS